MRRCGYWALLLWCWVAAATAAPAARDAGPVQALRERVDAVVAFLERHPDAPPAQVRAFIDQSVAPFVDFDRMAEWIAGPLGHRMDPGQRARFRDGLRETMLRALARNLAGYPVADVRYFPLRGDPAAGDVAVGLGIGGPNAIPVRLDFRLMAGPQGWRVVDVAANGLSAVATFRTVVAQMVQRYGVEGALARLD